MIILTENTGTTPAVLSEMSPLVCCHLCSSSGSDCVFQAYSNLLRANMDGLKKKDKKSKNKKSKATQ